MHQPVRLGLVGFVHAHAQLLIYTPLGYTYNAEYLPPGHVRRAMLITPWRGISIGGLSFVCADQEYTNGCWQ